MSLVQARQNICVVSLCERPSPFSDYKLYTLVGPLRREILVFGCAVATPLWSQEVRQVPHAEARGRWALRHGAQSSGAGLVIRVAVGGPQRTPEMRK